MSCMKIDHHIQESLIVRPQNSSPYPVFIQESFSPKGKIFLPERENEGSYFLIADSTLPTNILSPFLSDASHHFPKGKKDPHVIWFQGEEKNKNFHSMEPIYESLIQAGADRRSCLLALGGGVIGDLCGFVAASLFRGIDFIQIPTTLLAAVDASVGGKTGVNLRYGKNMIGSFHHPCLIYFNLSCLKSLPLRARIAGFAEMLKHSLLVSNPSVMDQLFCLSPQEDMRESNFQDLKLAIIHSIRIKSEIIAQDEKEKGLRAVLNLGHTTAHALESIYRQNTSDIDGMSHGEAVSRGLVTALLLSRRLKKSLP